MYRLYNTILQLKIKYSESVVFKWDQDPDMVHDKPEPQSCIGLCNPIVVHIFMHSPPKMAGGRLANY
jgi:hypothetical protein